jgi:hypothetical protein
MPLEATPKIADALTEEEMAEPVRIRNIFGLRDGLGV